MGHKKKGAPSSRSLHQQAYDRLTAMQAFGDSRRADKDEDPGISADKIYSFSTYKTYWKHIKYFVKWVKEKHSEVTTIKKAQKLVPEWLQSRVAEGLSAWTIQTEAAALNKLYGITPDDPNRFQPPRRRKEDIKRSRGTKVRDAHFSEAANEELVNFCKACGFRRNVLERLRGNDLYEREQAETALEDAKSAGDTALAKVLSDGLKTFPEQNWFILHRSDKGGKTRLAPIVGPKADRVVQRMKATPKDEKVWQYVNSNCDVHGYRSDYATYLYKQYARPIEILDFHNKIRCADGKYRSEIYICRSSERGKKLDRRAIGIISMALGHEREDTAIANYIRNL